MSSSSTETYVDVTMPQMGVSVAEGTVVEWKKQVGDWVEADEIIASISTDKIDTDVESPASGRVAEIVVQVGETVDVGTVMARIATDAQARRGARLRERRSPRRAPARPRPRSRPRRGRRIAGRHRDGASARCAAPAARRYSPVVMRIAAEHDVDLEQIEGTGRGGRVRKKDVLAYRGERAQGRAADAHREPVPARRAGRAEAAQAAPAARRGGARRPARPRRAAVATGGGQPLSRMRQAIGSRMVQSLQTAATCTTIAEADMTPDRGRAQGGRAQLPALPGAGDDRDAARVPGAQRHARGRHPHRLHRRRAPRASPSRSATGGLIVPIIRDAQDLSVEGLAKRIKDIARPRPHEPAHAGRGQRRHVHDHQPRRLRLDHGHAGDQPAAGRRSSTPRRSSSGRWWSPTSSATTRSRSAHMTYLCMGWDHRALDGALAAQFLTALRKKLEAWPIS